MPRTNPKSKSQKAYEVSFKDVQIDGQTQSWKTILPTFSCRDLLKHLTKKGLDLKVDDSRRWPDAVMCDDWDGDEINGRILRGSTTQIGRFRVRLIDNPDLVEDSIDDPTPAHTYHGAGYPTEVEEIPY